MQASEHPHKMATPLSQSLHGEITRTRFAKQSFECAVGRAVPHARQRHTGAVGSPAAAPRRHSGTGDASGSHHCARRSAAGSTCGTAPRPAARLKRAAAPNRATHQWIGAGKQPCRAPPNNRRRSRPVLMTIISCSSALVKVVSVKCIKVDENTRARPSRSNSSASTASLNEI